MAGGTSVAVGVSVADGSAVAIGVSVAESSAVGGGEVVVGVGGAEVAVGSSEWVHATRASTAITVIIASKLVRFRPIRPIRPILGNSVFSLGIKQILQPRINQVYGGCSFRGWFWISWE